MPDHTTGISDEQLRRIADGTGLAADERTSRATGVARIAAELLALRARVADLETTELPAAARPRVICDMPGCPEHGTPPKDGRDATR